MRLFALASALCNQWRVVFRNRSRTFQSPCRRPRAFRRPFHWLPTASLKLLRCLLRCRLRLASLSGQQVGEDLVSLSSESSDSDSEEKSAVIPASSARSASDSPGVPPSASLEAKGFLRKSATLPHALRAKVFTAESGDEVWLRPIYLPRAQSDSFFAAVLKGPTLCLRSSCLHRLKLL